MRARASSPSVSRVVLVDKPVGPTSFDMVRTARRGIGARVGHAGTLDPFASGLLVVLVGQATRISNLLMGLPKEYDLTVQFGATSSTADPTGEITPTGGRVTAAQVLGALDGLRGRIRQRVPLTSAVKVDGEALYKKAHRGETAETPEREVMVYDLTMLAFDEEAQTARLLALTGSGTYARVLAEVAGQTTGAGAYASALRRTRIGPFRVEDALAPDQLSLERYLEGGPGLLTLDEALAFLPRHDSDAAEAKRVANGNELPHSPWPRFRVYDGDRLLAIYERVGSTVVGTTVGGTTVAGVPAAGLEAVGAAAAGGAARPVVVFPETA